MKQGRSSGTTWAGIVGIAFLLNACSGMNGARGPLGPDDPETNVPKRPLPVAVPSVHVLQFEDPGDGTLVTPRGATPLGGDISTDVTAGSIMSADLIARAVANDRVKTALGDRYQFIGSERVETGKPVRHGCCAAGEPVHRLTFYSYSNRAAVVALVKGGDVIEVASRPGYQPPETQQEADEAIALVRQDNRLAGKLDGLDGHVILTEPGEGLVWNDPGYGHRVLWVTFSKGLEGRPLYWALVDLDERIVLKAREEPQE